MWRCEEAQPTTPAHGGPVQVSLFSGWPVHRVVCSQGGLFTGWPVHRVVCSQDGLFIPPRSAGPARLARRAARRSASAGWPTAARFGPRRGAPAR
eukprot:5753947-Prymnesium_polylepis.1